MGNFVSARVLWGLVMGLLFTAVLTLLLSAYTFLAEEVALEEAILAEVVAVQAVRAYTTASSSVNAKPISLLADTEGEERPFPTPPPTPIQLEQINLPANKLGKTAVLPPQGTLSPIFTKEVQYWEAEIMEWAAQYELDPNIIATIMQIESCGNPEALSAAGATGLFQVMPSHFAVGENMFDPAINAQRGLSYFNEGLRIHNGDIYLSFAGYNAGHGTVFAHPTTWPEETQRYFYWSKRIYEEANAGLATSPTLQEWMQAKGNNLCSQAAVRLGL